VGPVWHGGNKNEESLLADCYANSLKFAKEHNIKTIAFPAISTGAYRFPIDMAAKIAKDSVTSFLSKNPEIEKVIFVCFNQEIYDSY
jgi:O-acetyl-ADP-ribose deacetylase (regulator of RNase III)